MKPHLLAAITACLLGACATMSEDECRAADWRTFGLEDGARGVAVSGIGKYREACASHGIAPNLAEYQAGHAIGARSFCTPTNGYAKGRAGVNGYENFCPADLAAPFLDAYADGRLVHSADQRVARARQALDDIDDEINSIDELIIDYTAQVAADGVPAVERARLAKDLVVMGTRRSQLGTERPARARDLAAAESELAKVLREVGR